jgi:tRNA 2-thiouridine synthesizing protein A
VSADVEWNAGDLGCGDLVLELMTRMRAMPPGQVLRLVALDPGAPADIPAWCRMTGHTLLAQHPPEYLIRRKAPKEI